MLPIDLAHLVSPVSALVAILVADLPVPRSQFLTAEVLVNSSKAGAKDLRAQLLDLAFLAREDEVMVNLCERIVSGRSSQQQPYTVPILEEGTEVDLLH
jgi:hypothetical protein